MVKKKKYSITVGKKSDLQSAKVSGSQKSDHDGGNAITAENQDNTVEEAVCDCGKQLFQDCHTFSVSPFNVALRLTDCHWSNKALNVC